LGRAGRLAGREFGAPDSRRANPIPVCSDINNYGARSAVDERALPVDGLLVRLRGFRKSHHLIPAGLDPNKLWAIRGLQFAATRHVSACRPAACVSQSYL